MSVTLEKEQAALMKEEGKLKKLFKAIKKLFAKEFLWVLFILLLALPMALTITYVIETYGPKAFLAVINNFLDGKPIFIGAYGVSIAGIYFSRTVIGAIKTLTDKPKS
tara:strand:- start:202 stop:525 length:324 start_codon:yes stop_codon:yes gene_type:complete